MARAWPALVVGTLALATGAVAAPPASTAAPSTAVPARAAPPLYLDGEALTDEGRAAAVSRFEIVTLKRPTIGGGHHRVRADALCDAPVDLVFKTLVDVRGYERFMPKVTRSRVLKSDGRTMRVLIETRLPWPIENSWNILDVTVATMKGGYSITWDRVEGSFKTNRGFWAVSAADTPMPRTRLAYEIEVYVPPLVPDFVIDKGFRRIAADYVHGLRAEVTRRKDALASGTTR